MTATIPGVRQQVKRWATTSKPAERSRETLGVRDVEVLGMVRRSTFATVKADGRELRLRGPAMPYDIEQAPASAVIVSRQVRDREGRTREEHFIGKVIPAGTFEGTARAARYRPKARSARPVDRDAELRRELTREAVELGADHDDAPASVIKAALGRRPRLLVTDGRPAFMSIAAEIAWLESRGVRLVLAPDRTHLLVATAKALTAERRAMLNVRSDLYRGHLAGTPVRCVWPHDGEAPEAVTIAVGHAPVCAAHLAGTAPLTGEHRR